MFGEAIPPELLGPTAALALLLLFLSLVLSGKVLSRNTVPREDYKQLQDVNASYAAALGTLTKSVDELVTTVRYLQRNGSGGVR